MGKDELETEAEENARLAAFAERFERGEIEIDTASVSHVELARQDVFETLWHEYMEDREERPLEGIAIREDVLVAFEAERGSIVGVFMTLPGLVVGDDIDDFDERVRDFVEQETGVAREEVQVSRHLVRADSMDATLIRVMHLLGTSGRGRADVEPALRCSGVQRRSTAARSGARTRGRTARRARAAAEPPP